MKKLFALILALALMMTLAACEKKDTLTDVFRKELESAGLELGGEATERLKGSLAGAALKRETGKERNFKLVASMITRDPVVEHGLDEIKRFARAFAEVAISAAKECELDNSYYLYVNMNLLFSVSFVYDYETDTLYVPEDWTLIAEMYDKFGTTYMDSAASEEGGPEWLIEQGLAEYKHGELEITGRWWSPSVYINEDGEFSSYRLDAAHEYVG